MTHLTNIRKLGRYKHKNTCKQVNIHRGDVVGRGTEVLFYLYRNNRVYVTQREFCENWQAI